jgi:hypothetical protein
MKSLLNNSKIALTIFVLIPMMLSACNALQRDLSVSQISDLKAEVYNQGSRACVHITGSVMDSVWGIRSIETVYSGQTERIFVRLSPSDSKYYGTLDYTTCPPYWVKQIYYGEEEKLLWSYR